MARRKKRAAPKIKPAKDVTPQPEKNKRKIKAGERFKFHQNSVDREVERMTNELKAIGERMIKANKEAHEEFMTSVPKEIGNLTLKEFFDAGYMLDYGIPCTGKFVSLGPMHYEIIDEQAETAVAQSAKKKPAVSRQTISDSKPPGAVPDAFSTPAVGVAPPIGNLFITPKVVPRPKRGFIVVYTENGSPYQLNLATMKARHPTEAESSTPATATRSTRVTRATRAASKR